MWDLDELYIWSNTCNNWDIDCLITRFLWCFCLLLYYICKLIGRTQHWQNQLWFHSTKAVKLSRNSDLRPHTPLDFLSQSMQNCPNNKNISSKIDKFSTFVILKQLNVHSNSKGMSYRQVLTSWAALDTLQSEFVENMNSHLYKINKSKYSVLLYLTWIPRYQSVFA